MRRWSRHVRMREAHASASSGSPTTPPPWAIGRVGVLPPFLKSGPATHPSCARTPWVVARPGGVVPLWPAASPQGGAPLGASPCSGAWPLLSLSSHRDGATQMGGRRAPPSPGAWPPTSERQAHGWLVPPGGFSVRHQVGRQGRWVPCRAAAAQVFWHVSQTSHRSRGWSASERRGPSSGRLAAESPSCPAAQE